jgi:hypothetical protein
METPQLSTHMKEFKDFRRLRSSKRGARSQNPGARRAYEMLESWASLAAVPHRGMVSLFIRTQHAGQPSIRNEEPKNICDDMSRLLAPGSRLLFLELLSPCFPVAFS